MGRADWETLLLLYLLFGTRYTRPSKSFNYDLVDIRTLPLTPPTRTSYQELALNSLRK